jgi:hypothetical protein
MASPRETLADAEISNLSSPIAHMEHVMIEDFELSAFRIVADTRNFRRAADELHLIQPAITAQIKSLEENLSIALLDRVGRDISLTPTDYPEQP